MVWCNCPSMVRLKAASLVGLLCCLVLKNYRQHENEVQAKCVEWCCIVNSVVRQASLLLQAWSTDRSWHSLFNLATLPSLWCNHIQHLRSHGYYEIFPSFPSAFSWSILILLHKVQGTTDVLIINTDC